MIDDDLHLACRFDRLFQDPAKKTVCLYGHLDVQPAILEDGWATEPFVLTEKDGKLFGRGSSDDKGPVLGWLHAIEGFQAIGEPLPVNLKFVFEGMEESGSEGLDDLLYARQKDFLSDVDECVYLRVQRACPPLLHMPHHCADSYCTVRTTVGRDDV